VTIAGDGVLLSELCANLLDNAIRYTPQGGIVTVSLHRDGEAVLLDVEDSGPGIDDAQIQQALMPFHRLENVGDNPGAGLDWRWSAILRACTAAIRSCCVETLGGVKVRLRLEGRSE
jgi:two-component system sensor histidine kinase TctE